MKFARNVLAVAICCYAAATYANVTISGTVTNAQNDVGVDIAASRLTLLVIDAGDDGFGNLLPGSFFDDAYLTGASDPDLFLAGIGSSFNFGDGIASFALTSVNLNITNGLGNAWTSQGDAYYVLWFPDLASTVTNLTVGDRFGFARFSDWDLPADSGSIIGTTVNGGLATETVIPEPSTAALIVVGLFVAGLHFRRRK